MYNLVCCKDCASLLKLKNFLKFHFLNPINFNAAAATVAEVREK
jgi:hypothetical protein